MSTNNLGASPQLITRNLITTLHDRLEEANAVYWIVSFILSSGVNLVLPALQAAESRGIPIKILTGDYLYITEPSALKLLMERLPQAEIRLWQSEGHSFHAKAYLFSRAHHPNSIIVGSSNWSASALTHGIEWNLSAEDRSSIALEEFMRLFYADQTHPINPVTWLRYHEQYHQFHAQNPQIPQVLSERESLAMMFNPDEDLTTPLESDAPQALSAIEPNPIQLQVLKSLESTQTLGYQKGLVVLPTGLGKTYLAAFFARSFGRVLFVAHRDEILGQAQNVFQRIFPHRQFQRYANDAGDLKSDGVFASVFTLSLESHQYRFDSKHFDLIIVDEFHHAAAPSYQHIFQYFRPRFLLGLTATPDRTDGRDIFNLCDGNIAYELSLTEAITQQWLSPFHYFGVYDPIDYSALRWRRSHYDDEDLVRAQTTDNHAEAVFRAWQSHRQQRTLGFCSSVRHADFLAKQFTQRGARCTFVHAGSGLAHRKSAIDALKRGHLDIIFSVDLFNEGVDIPEVDTILLIRPTQSSIVFIQQIGRGLRIHPQKSHCTVIDLIGNYRNADAKLRWLGINEAAALARPQTLQTNTTLPPLCRIDLELQVIDILERLQPHPRTKDAQVKEAYLQLKEELGRIPSYLEFHLQAGVDSRLVHQHFHAFVGLKDALGELTAYENEIWQKYHGLLQEMEATPMTKSFKMIVLKAMLARGPHRWPHPMTSEAAAPFFHRYLTEAEYRKQIDFADKSNRSLWTYSETGTARLIKRMPMTQWHKESQKRHGWVELTSMGLTIHVPQEDPSPLDVLHSWLEEIADYRLHTHFERKGSQKSNGRRGNL